MVRLRVHSLLLLLACGCAAAPTGTPAARLVSHKGQRALVLRGTAFEMGKAHGELLAEEVRTVVRETLVWTVRKGLSREKLDAMWRDLSPHVPARYHDEMRGLALGSSVPLVDIQHLHAMPSEFHCSGAAAARTMTADGKLYHTRSLDYALDIGVDDRLQNHALLIVRVPDDGIASAVPAWAGFLGAVTGVNLRGISVGEMGSKSRDESLHGMPMIFTLQEVLRRSTDLEGAVAILEKGPRTCGFNYIVGSGDERRATAIEVTRNHFFRSGFADPAENVAPHRALPDAVRRTNHFVGPRTAATQPELSYLEGSTARYQQITGYLEAHRGRLDALAMIGLLRKYPPDHACLHQAVICATDRVLWLAQAVDDRASDTPGAQNQEFVRWDLRELAGE